jgi:hypothetical protein
VNECVSHLSVAHNFEQMSVDFCLQFASQPLQRPQGLNAEYLDFLQVLQGEDDGTRIAVYLRYRIIQTHFPGTAHAPAWSRMDISHFRLSVGGFGQGCVTDSAVA